MMDSRAQVFLVNFASGVLARIIFGFLALIALIILMSAISWWTSDKIDDRFQDLSQREIKNLGIGNYLIESSIQVGSTVQQVVATVDLKGFQDKKREFDHALWVFEEDVTRLSQMRLLDKGVQERSLTLTHENSTNIINDARQLVENHYRKLLLSQQLQEHKKQVIRKLEEWLATLPADRRGQKSSQWQRMMLLVNALMVFESAFAPEQEAELLSLAAQFRFSDSSDMALDTMFSGESGLITHLSELDRQQQSNIKYKEALLHLIEINLTTYKILLSTSYKSAWAAEKKVHEEFTRGIKILFFCFVISISLAAYLCIAIPTSIRRPLTR